MTKPEPGVSPPAPERVLPISVIVPVRNEARNLPPCLQALHRAHAGEVYVIDSASTDATASIAESHGAKVVQFHYVGGWPKKRQWAMNTLPLAYDWILLLDADEVLTPELADEIENALRDPGINGYYITLQTYYLGRCLRFSGGDLRKLSLFRKGSGRFECRLQAQDLSMADMEIHEHVVVDGPTCNLIHPLIHHNVESLSRYIQKHNEYSNWEARVLRFSENAPKSGSANDLDAEALHADALHSQDAPPELPPNLFGTQAQRRRWLKRYLYRLPGSPLLLFFYWYVFRLGFLDGVPGLLYCTFQAVQMFHTKAKIYETKINEAKINQAKINDAKINDAKINDAKINEAKINEAKINKTNIGEINATKLNQTKIIHEEITAPPTRTQRREGS